MHRHVSALLATVFFLPGCGPDIPDVPGELNAEAGKARDAAKLACERNDHEAASDAAERAAKCAERLEKIAEEGDDNAAEAKKFLADTDAAAREAGRWAELAEEQHELARKLNGLKAKAYRGGRSLAVKALFKGLSLAADQAGKRGIENLPDELKDLALSAAQLAGDMSGREPLEDGSPDWTAVSQDMSAFAKEPPKDMPLFLAAAFFLTLSSDPALYEIEMVDAAGLETEEDRLTYHVLRALIYRINGFSRLAIREVETLSDGEDTYDPEFQAGLHMLSAYFFLHDKDYTKADQEIGRAMQADPNNPLAVYLTGERLAADGEWEKAAKSLEAAAAGSEDEWLADRIAQHARDVRDNRGESQSLILDKQFLAAVTLEYAGRAAARSEAGRKIKSWVDSAVTCGKNLLGDASEKEEETKPAAGR
ncbi:MAG: hypothetical protein H8E44_42570 [Planctomycetes bacterium]|nr:hypothetical protein [Planctomycetota bacterium]MBL7042006.1 hypothetical protein [Pirellulaceae bacterium]